MKRRLKILLFVSVGFLFLLNTPIYADEGKKSALKGIEVLTGFGKANLQDKEHHYQVYPLFVGFNFNLKPLVKKTGVNYPGLMEFILEPFVSYVAEPNSNAELGTNLLFKIGILPETSKFQPYLKGGIGVVYMTQHTREQGTQFNFNEYAGAGAHYFFKKNIALTAEYRYRHISNADIDKPNSGIDTHMGLIGLSYLF
jgi:hypothetical protein